MPAMECASSVDWSMSQMSTQVPNTEWSTAVCAPEAAWWPNHAHGQVCSQDYEPKIDYCMAQQQVCSPKYDASMDMSMVQQPYSADATCANAGWATWHVSNEVNGNQHLGVLGSNRPEIISIDNARVQPCLSEQIMQYNRGEQRPIVTAVCRSSIPPPPVSPPPLLPPAPLSPPATPPRVEKQVPAITPPPPPRSSGGGNSFRIDSQIRAVGESDVEKNRRSPLQRWEDGNGAAVEHLQSLERSNDTSGWDQFEENRKKFGVVSTFKQDLSQYTTPLNLKQIPKDVKERADRIADEIEREGNVRKADRVRQKLGGDEYTQAEEGCDNVDEEEMWSSVPRCSGAPPWPRPPATPLCGQMWEADAKTQQARLCPRWAIKAR